MKVALTIAGSDPGGGAGVQADLKTFAALQVYGASVVTAITVQDTRGVSDWAPVTPLRMVGAQLDAVLGDLEVASVKTGMLGSAAAVHAIADRLGPRKLPLVVDPVLAPSAGAAFADADLVRAMKERLFAIATLVTPNLPEAESLTGRTGLEAAKAIADLGARFVLVKGGHGSGPASDDLLWDGHEARTLSGRRIETSSTHGTGCTLSAAIAAWLARGEELPEAARRAKRYVEGALASARPLGRGNGPLHHLHPFYPWEPNE